MDISYEKILYRIIKGRLRIKLGDLILYVYEPTSDILEESYEIYDEAYQKAYYNNVFIEEELRQLLYEFHLWNPADDKKIKELDKKIEELKLEAYKLETGLGISAILLPSALRFNLPFGKIKNTKS